MILMIDNYDSFVYNLATYFKELHCDIEIYRNDKITINEIEFLIEEKKLEGIILSPGPKSPLESEVCLDIVNTFSQRIPILGVCLGHQIIGYCSGCDIIKAPIPVHGKISSIKHTGKRLFHNLPNPMNVTRYHSLIVDEKSLSDDFYIDGKTDDGIIMAISHKEYPLYGVQFHPEAVLTQEGHALLNNFIIIAKEWHKNENHH